MTAPHSMAIWEAIPVGVDMRHAWYCAIDEHTSLLQHDGTQFVGMFIGSDTNVQLLGGWSDPRATAANIAAILGRLHSNSVNIPIALYRPLFLDVAAYVPISAFGAFGPLPHSVCMDRKCAEMIGSALHRNLFNNPPFQENKL